MKAGKLRHRIALEQLVETQDPDTGAIDTAWSTFAADVPAEILPMSGREILAAQAVESGARVRFVIRAGLAIDTRMRVAHEGLAYNITEIVLDPTLRRHVTIMAEAGVRNG